MIAALALALSVAFAADSPRCTVQTEIRDVIGPATTDLLKRVEAMAEREGCGSILLLVNTPGGSLETTRTLVEMMMNSPYAYLCLVSPSGGHAGSAGAIILQACHVNGALHGTNLGAATPISSSGELPKDLLEKILNDTRSWMESLTRLRGRSETFGKDIILDAKAVSAEEALKLKAVDFAGVTVEEFLKFSDGRKVKMKDSQIAEVHPGAIKVFTLDTRYKILSTATDPQFAYSLLLGSLGLLYFEATHPGVLLPGVAGAVGLVVALIAMNKLEVEWAGLLLIFLGVGMLIAELFLPSFGALLIGGLVSLFLGSIFLFDPVKTGGYRLPYIVILPTLGLFAVFFTAVTVLVYRTRAVKKKGGFEDLLGLEGKVMRLDSESTGFLELRGETWKFESATAIKLHDTVQVLGHSGLVLKVAPVR